MSLRILCAALLLTSGAARAQEQASYSADTPVEKIAADPAAAEVLNKDIPGLLTDSQYSMFKGMSLKQLHRASNGELSTETVDKAVADLQALPH
jgi:hypothetical protein